MRGWHRVSIGRSAVVVIGLVLTLVGSVSGTAASVASERGSGGAEVLRVEILSNRADLVSGGDVLAEVVLPRGAKVGDLSVWLDGRDVTDDFVARPEQGGRILGLVRGLREGDNRLEARLSGSRAAHVTITNHPIGGPVFSGPQIQPWWCDTEEAGLGSPTDKQCNAPTRYEFFYRSTDPAKAGFQPYDRANPPGDVAETTTDQGKTVPYIVRVETGTINRSIYDVAVLFDPSRPWQPWAPQDGWNGKVNWIFGCDGTPGHRQEADRNCASPDLHKQHELLNDMALGRGFAVADSSHTNLGNNLNTTVHAETMMMVKERIVERYGAIRYTIGTGCSGGSISQHGVANQYPGLIQGLRPECSFPDMWSVATVNSFDCPLLNRYFDTVSPTLWLDPVQRDAVYGYEVDSGAVSASQGNVFCHSPLGAYRPGWWDPSVGGDEDGAEDGLGAIPVSCVPQSQVYDAQSNPRGVRCSAQDYLVNIVGRRPSTSWGPVERSIGEGFANRFLDNVGVQYGLEALRRGAITPEQFVDLNEKIGGLDIDAQWQPERSQADLAGVERMYRSGQIVEGYELDQVAIIDYRPDWNDDVHSNRQSAITRERMRAANGHLDNRAEWLEPGRNLWGQAPQPELSFRVMDQWLARVEADTSSDPLPVKIANGRPAEAADGCFQDGQRTGPQACSNYSIDEDPRLVAGMPDTRDILKCQLKPLTHGDYNATFTQGQWARLHRAFPAGVCDWSKPGVGQQPNTPWLTYQDGPGGRPLGLPPRSEAG